jgi:predicted nuclease of predicted toxin-antitoxin system
MGFNAVNAEHLAIAIDQTHADVLVTKDRDFHDREEEQEKLTFNIPLRLSRT